MNSLMSYFEQGGVIMYILLFLNVLGFSVMIYKFFVIYFVKRKKDSYIDRLVLEVSSNKGDFAITRAKDHITKDMIKLESGLGIIKSIASIAPLLGLLGTVIGVLLSFKQISKVGLDDPSIFAGGISLALITTIAGLIVAIPHYIGYNFLISSLDRLEAELKSEVGDRL